MKISSFLRKIFIYPIRFYQKNVSPYRARCCRFYPTCSAYAVEAITERGIFIGTALSVWRLLRCNPFCKGGYDPVPLSRRERMRRENENRDCRCGCGNDNDTVD